MENIFKKVNDIASVSKIPSIKILGCKFSKNNAPYFTIAIPTFKRISTLSESIESALKQVGFDNYNIIVCDNNPERNDETELFMSKYAHESKLSYYKHTENLGMAGNWNKCALLSEAEHIILLHDDDILSPYALNTFYEILKGIKDDWASIKAGVIKFSDIEALKFEKPTRCSIRTVSKIDFWKACPVGAPTGILLKRDTLLQIGGVHSRFFPCIDYEMSFNLSTIGKSYIFLNDVSLCGYRVANNESLSEKTMDKYFEQRINISSQIMKSMFVPKRVINYLQSYYTYRMYNNETKYYNMSDYKLKDEFTHTLIKYNHATEKLMNLFLRIAYKINKILQRSIVIEISK